MFVWISVTLPQRCNLKQDPLVCLNTTNNSLSFFFLPSPPLYTFSQLPRHLGTACIFLQCLCLKYPNFQVSVLFLCSVRADKYFIQNSFNLFQHFFLSNPCWLSCAHSDQFQKQSTVLMVMWACGVCVSCRDAANRDSISSGTPNTALPWGLQFGELQTHHGDLAKEN